MSISVERPFLLRIDILELFDLVPSNLAIDGLIGMGDSTLRDRVFLSQALSRLSLRAVSASA